MGRKASEPVPGQSRRVKVKLSPELNEDLWAFCEVFHGAPHNRIIEKAVRAFIKSELQKHPTLAAEWDTLRAKPRTKPELVAFRPPPDKQSD